MTPGGVLPLLSPVGSWFPVKQFVLRQVPPATGAEGELDPPLNYHVIKKHKFPSPCRFNKKINLNEFSKYPMPHLLFIYHSDILVDIDHISICLLHRESAGWQTPFNENPPFLVCFNLRIRMEKGPKELLLFKFLKY